jgi:dihydroxyacetone kinase-like predicted kinase
MSSKILVVCANEEILKVILRLINTNENWEAIGKSTIQETFDVLFANHFALLLIGSGFSEAEEQQLEQYVKSRYPDLRISKHYGGGSGLLFAEIFQALS